MVKRPDRYLNAIVPHIYVERASYGIAFYKRAFGAVELFRIAHPNGKILHAEISICGSVVMIGDPDDRLYGEPRALGRCTAGLHIFLDDNEACCGARSTRAPKRSSHPLTCSTVPVPSVCAIPSAMSGCSCPGSKISIRPKWNVVETRS
jgi:hypothetical protein